MRDKAWLGEATGSTPDAALRGVATHNPKAAKPKAPKSAATAGRPPKLVKV